MKNLCALAGALALAAISHACFAQQYPVERRAVSEAFLRSSQRLRADHLSEFMKREIAKLTKLAKAANVKAE